MNSSQRTILVRALLLSGMLTIISTGEFLSPFGGWYLMPHKLIGKQSPKQYNRFVIFISMVPKSLIKTNLRKRPFPNLPARLHTSIPIAARSHQRVAVAQKRRVASVIPKCLSAAPIEVSSVNDPHSSPKAPGWLGLVAIASDYLTRRLRILPPS